MSNLHIVIARYNESLDWLDTCLTPHQRRSVWVYDKGASGSLPNIGREAHTYLTHIIENWDNLPERVYFLQGDPFPHLEFQPSFEMIQKWFRAWDSQINRGGFSKNIKVNDIDRNYREPNTDPCPLNFGDWMEAHVAPFRSPIHWYTGAIFGVSGANIKNRSKEYYIKLLEEFQTLKPETAYYIERCWFYVFQL
jgi:Protein of unknown function (DUF3431)